MGVFPFILLVFPIAEIMVLARVGHAVGFWNTCFLLVLSAVVGVHFAKQQGQSVLLKIQQCLSEGRLPDQAMLDGMLVFVGGLLFVFPGFISDFIGFLLVFPLSRWGIHYILLQSFRGRFTGQSSTKADPAQRRMKSSEFQDRPRGSVKDAEIVD